MRIPFFSMFITSPFSALQEHAEKVKECSWAFQQAMECRVSESCDSFEQLRQEVIRFENEADIIKKRIRGHLPKDVTLPVEKFQLLSYLREQDQVKASVLHALHWLSCPTQGVPRSIEREFFLLLDAVIEPVEELAVMAAEAQAYFMRFSKKQRQKVKEVIENLRQMRHEADQREQLLIHKIFQIEKDPISLFHLVRLTQAIGEIADHAENAADMMQGMLAR